MTASTFIVVPGLRGSAPSHWQELFEACTERAVAVPFPPQERWHSIEERTRPLGETIAAVNGPVVLVAHSAGCSPQCTGSDPSPTVPPPSRRCSARYSPRPDFGVEWPEPHPRSAELSEVGWEPIPRRRLPFPPIVAASRNDPLARYRVSAGLAEAWGSRLVDLGDAGHLNPASGFGEWPLLDELVAELTTAHA